jgi:FixJ family two-component response regulator
MSSPLPLIAVLDDEANMRVALARLLGLRGYEVATFDSAEGLLAACQDSPVRCIILDLHMPGLNGFDVLERLSSRPEPPPVIVITGHDQAGTEERVRNLGACAYFTKPVVGARLLETLEHLNCSPHRSPGPG